MRYVTCNMQNEIDGWWPLNGNSISCVFAAFAIFAFFSSPLPARPVRRITHQRNGREKLHGRRREARGSRRRRDRSPARASRGEAAAQRRPDRLHARRPGGPPLLEALRRDAEGLD